MDKKESILIVDDDESTCKSLSLILGKKGYETETAGTGREALKKAQGRFFNVALLDIRLPDIEGVELLMPLRKIHPDMIVFMITGYPSLETSVRTSLEGALAYITKPLDMDTVLTAIREALEKQRPRMEKRRLYKEARQELAEQKQVKK